MSGLFGQKKRKLNLEPIVMSLQVSQSICDTLKPSLMDPTLKPNPATVELDQWECSQISEHHPPWSTTTKLAAVLLFMAIEVPPHPPALVKIQMRKKTKKVNPCRGKVVQMCTVRRPEPMVGELRLGFL